MKEISEYQQVSAIVCMDIDALFKCAEKSPDDALVFFRMLKEKKDEVVSNPKIRTSRYLATSAIFNIYTRDEVVACACMGPHPICLCKQDKLKNGEGVTGSDGVKYAPENVDLSVEPIKILK